MSSMSRTARAVTAGAVAVSTMLIGTGAASAGGHTKPKPPKPPVVSAPIVDGLGGPLQFEVSDGGSILVAQSLSETGTVAKISRKGVVKNLFDAPGVDGVAAGPWGSTYYTHTGDQVAELHFRTKEGEDHTLADLYQYESTKNPDQVQTYGMKGLSPDCEALFPPDAQIVPYPGHVDSHPYALTPVFGGVLIADAAANAILFVDYWGGIHTVAVLPPAAPVVVTEEAATANDLPPCVIGASFVAEPVPTDVEVGRDGLYVSTLPGGPEDPSLGARGAVYRVNPFNGKSKLIASGFAGATNLAISPSGTVYVSELFGDQVSKVVGNHGVPVASVPMPSGLEWSNGKLYAGIDTFGSGKIVTITP